MKFDHLRPMIHDLVNQSGASTDNILLRICELLEKEIAYYTRITRHNPQARGRTADIDPQGSSIT